MVTLPLGVNAYKRQYAGQPEIKLRNRFMEASPPNLREKIALLTRPGSNELNVFPSGIISGNRGQFFQEGLFGDDLFVASGPNLYRYASDGTKTHILGLLNGTNAPVAMTWMKGIGYEFLFIADGLLLQFYNGGTHATGTLSGTVTNQVIDIGGTYYSWNVAVDTNAPDGTSAHPWLADPGTDPLTAMANLINFAGVRGVDFSTDLGGPSQLVTATTSPPNMFPATGLVISAISPYTDGNSIVSTVFSGTGIAWTAATLTGGGVHTLQGVEMPNGVSAKSLTNLSGYVLVSVGDSQQFYWINPGETTIDPLDFASKESNPDPINDMVTVGDQAILVGAGSTENWYATGDFNAPFAPVEGRVYRRGCTDGTVCVVKDAVMLVGNDGIVYTIGYNWGDTSQYGVHRTSTHAIEERIRVELYREQGLT